MWQGGHSVYENIAQVYLRPLVSEQFDRYSDEMESFKNTFTIFPENVN